MKYAVIGGTGFESLLEQAEELEVPTPYGRVKVYKGILKNVEVFFLPRHGVGHEAPPHRVNYRANIYSLHKLGVERIVALNAVGAINENFKPGDLVVPHDYVDFTKNRVYTFYDRQAFHVDVSEPYCPEVRSSLIEAARKICGKVWDKAVYIATEGPRYETPAEIRIFKLLGCDVVGMTGCPEAALARELGLCYGSLCLVTNMAAGLQDRLTTSEVLQVAKSSFRRVVETVALTLSLIPEERGCRCREAALEAEFNSKL